MLQLSFAVDDSLLTLDECLAALEAEACRRGLRAEHLDAARDAVVARFRSVSRDGLDDELRARVRAYYHAVVRRRVLGGRGTDAAEARRRLVRRSIEDDLVSAGWDRRRAAAEAARVTGVNRAGAA